MNILQQDASLVNYVDFKVIFFLFLHLNIKNYKQLLIFEMFGSCSSEDIAVDFFLIIFIAMWICR
jgi:hypothetical protein